MSQIFIAGAGTGLSSALKTVLDSKHDVLVVGKIPEPHCFELHAREPIIEPVIELVETNLGPRRKRGKGNKYHNQ